MLEVNSIMQEPLIREDGKEGVCMCIYYGNSQKLTYKSREHVLPAALGCCTKLEKGVVSDQANDFFSPIEREVLEHSFLQIPRIINGPGKRGKLTNKYATTSKVSVININGKNGLGYMKGTDAYSLSQFIIDENNNIQFKRQKNENIDVKNEMEQLKEHICSMEEKYVLVKMPPDDNCIYITYFKNKIHIGVNDKKQLSERKIGEIKGAFSRNFDYKSQNISCGQPLMTLEVNQDFKNICIVAIKSVLNTLAYIKGTKYVEQSTDLKNIVKEIMCKNDNVTNYVKKIGFKDVKMLRQKLFLDNRQLSCILTKEKNSLRAWLLVYEYGFEITLCETCIAPGDILLEGIVCDWKNRKDYLYSDFLIEKEFSADVK